MAVYTKKYNGSSWVTAPFKKWNGSSWVDATVKKYNGSAWVQIYPETAVTTSKTLSGSNLNTYRNKWLNDSVAKQGTYSSYGASHGYLAVSATSLAGYGGISAISSASFSGTRDGSGYYNNNQTLKFYRSNIAPASSSPVNTLSGQFTGTTGGPGSGGAMSNRAIAVNSETLNWANNVSSKPYLYIYSDAAADYAGIKTSFSITLNYTYTAKMLTYAAKDAQPILMSRDMYKMETGKDPYCSILVHEGEENMSLDEIIERRENGISEFISFDSIVEDYEAKPWTREYNVEYNKETKTCKAKIEVFNMGMNDEVQYSLDKEEWNTMYNIDANTQYHEAELPKDFNRFADFVFIRVINKEKEEVVTNMTIEPKIFIPDQTKGIIIPGDIDLKNLLTK